MQDWTATVPERTLPNRGSRPGRVLLIVVGTLLGVCCIASGTAAVVRSALTTPTRGSGTGSAGGAAGQSVQGAAGEASPAGPVQPGIGDPVRDGQFEFVVRSAECGHPTIDNGWLHAEAKGQFCVVELSVTNIGTEARNFGDGLQRGFGPSGEKYAVDTGAGVVANGNGRAIWDAVNPGISFTAKIVYDIPVGATLTALELHDGAFSHGVTVHCGQTEESAWAPQAPLTGEIREFSRESHR
jgi:uncharacterized protein DUF4352